MYDRDFTVAEMSMRDYFAAAALQGLIASYGTTVRLPDGKEAAEVAYCYAEAMLKAREA